MSVLSLLDRAVERRPEHTFLRHEGRKVGYAELDRWSNRVANALLELGVRKGDRVTLALGNSLEYVAAAFGIMKTGAILHPINPALGQAQLAWILDHAGPRAIVTDRRSGAGIAALHEKLPRGCTLAGLDGPEGALDLAARIERSSERRPPVEVGPEDGAMLLYTSGTTGDPKGVLNRHGAWEDRHDPFISVLGISGDDTVLAVTPLFHGNAWGGVATALRVGGTAAFPAEFRASEFWPLVHETGATVLFTLGTILAILLTQPPSELERRSPLRLILGLGSAPVRDRVIERFGVSDVAECFGSTDAGVVTITPRGEPPRAGSAGKAIPDVSIRILDDAGRPLPPGEAGEIAVLRSEPRSEYFREPEQTAAAYRDGWFLTGDLGYLDADGWLYFVDRKKDIIRRGGENISSVLIEKTLREHPAVVEAAVIGVPDPVLGQEVKAFVVPKGAVSAEELRAFVAARLAPFEVPRLWEMRDALPRTPTQRIEKYKLREEAGAVASRPLG